MCHGRVDGLKQLGTYTRRKRLGVSFQLACFVSLPAPALLMEHGNIIRTMKPSNNAGTINKKKYNCKNFWRRFLRTRDVPGHNYHTTYFLCTNEHCWCCRICVLYVCILCVFLSVKQRHRLLTQARQPSEDGETKQLCKECPSMFTLTEATKQWYLSCDLHIPLRCDACRLRRKQQAAPLSKKKSTPAKVILYQSLPHSGNTWTKCPSPTAIHSIPRTAPQNTDIIDLCHQGDSDENSSQHGRQDTESVLTASIDFNDHQNSLRRGVFFATALVASLISNHSVPLFFRLFP